MTKKLLLVGLAIAVVAPSGRAFEFRTHHGVTAAARQFLLSEESGYQCDEEFRTFLNLTDPDGYNLIDSRAGDPFEGASLDEDHREGRLAPDGGACSYRELLCGPVCSKDHFHPFFGLVDALGGVDAVEHAYHYLTGPFASTVRPGASRTAPGRTSTSNGRRGRWGTSSAMPGAWRSGSVASPESRRCPVRPKFYILVTVFT